MMKKILYCVLTLVMGLVLSGSGCGTDPMPPDGSEGRPFIITTPAELDNIRNELTMHYKLGRSIDLSGYLATGGAGYLKANWGAAGWLPIGTSSARFKGCLDGAGYTISGLWINRTTTDYIGLFGSLDDGATLKNLGVAITAAGVKGRNYVGGVAGAISGGTISHCYATGTVSGTNYVGGLAGVCYDNIADKFGRITNCYATGAVSGTDYVGGLAGECGITTNCYATGTVSGTNYVGGLAGCSFRTSHCYATGAVSGINSVGGLVGVNYSECSITHCYATGTVSGTNSVGGLVGCSNSVSGIGISNCVALNPSVRATGADVGRVLGVEIEYLFYNGRANNWASSGMTNGGGIAFPSGNGLTHLNGANVSAGTATGQYNNATWWTSTGANGPGWSSTIWTFTTGTGQLPKFK